MSVDSLDGMAAIIYLTQVDRRTARTLALIRRLPTALPDMLNAGAPRSQS